MPARPKMKRLIPILLTLSAVVPASMYGKTSKPVTLSESVRHSLAMMPRFSVFDELKFQVDGGTVTLTGEVTQPIVKDDAAYAVVHVEGVTNVVNNIEVLPLSPNDDRVRRAVYRAIYSNSVLSPYQLRAVPPIHIIVKNGQVTLEGAVARQMDKQVAGIKANGVSGVFGVTNNLMVDEPENKDDKKK